MRILFINHNLRDRGTYHRAFNIACELVRRGHTATLWCASPDHWYRPQFDESDGVKIVETPSWNPWINRDDGWGPLDLMWRMGHIPFESCDLIYAFAHPPTVFLPAVMGRLLRRVPLIADWCDVYRDGIFPLREKIRAESAQRVSGLQRTAERIEENLEWSFLRRADGVTVISSYLEHEAIQAGVSSQRILRCHSGSPIGAIHPLDKKMSREALRDKGFTFDDDSIVLGYLASYNPDERFLLASLKTVVARYPKARLLAVCPEFSQSALDEYGIVENIVSLGRVPFNEIQTTLGASDILLLPLEDNESNRGRWPNKFGDYLAAGRPIATCDIGDIATYFPKKENPTSYEEIGVATPCNSDDYARGIIDLIAHPEKRNEMGLAARRLAEGELAWPKIAEQIENFLQRFVR